MHKRLLLPLASILFSSAASARKLPNYDVLETVSPRAVRQAPAAQASAVARLARPGTTVHLDERLGVPQFLWASKPLSANVLSALRAGRTASSALATGQLESAASAARAHLGAFAPAYGLSALDVDTAVVSHVHDIGRGPVIVQFEQIVDGLEVFRERTRVIMDRNHELIALSGHITGTGAESFAIQSSFRLGAADAVASAYSDLSGNLVDSSAMQSFGGLEGGYESLDLTPGLKRTLAGATTQPARTKPVWFHGLDGLQPAYYVEVDSANGPAADSYGYVISAVDGSVLLRNDLTADAAPNAYTYRVWAADPSDPRNPSAPFDGPQGNAFDPHPTGTLDGTQPPGPVPQADVTLVSSPYAGDPWLPIGAVETTGNNVDSYADIGGADGFTAGTDFRAGITGPNAFQYSYDTTQPNTAGSMKAALVQMFYNVNFWHDWYYRSGFTESAGNAQTNNYGRGGVAGDNIRAEGQDFSGRNNANMNTPADGGRPRMQMFLFDGIAPRHLFATGAGLAADYSTGVPSGWGIAAHDVTADVVWVNDGVGSTVYPPATTTTSTVHDGCNYTPGAGGAVDPNWANVTGKIALIDRGGVLPNGVSCGFQDKAVNAQRAGAAGVLIASTTTHGAPTAIAMGATVGDGPVSIPVYQLSTPDGDVFRAALTAGTVTVRMLRDPAVDRDGTVDNQIMAHEWGHYISNRLVQNSAGLTTNMARGMGEGWADFHALLLTVKEEDAEVPSNRAYDGVYALSVWVETGGANGPSSNQGAYFGIRRMPYSTDLTKNNMMYKNIQDNSAVPVGVPFSNWPAPGTTAVNGGNSEVHNTGEVWATMLWECYASMLKRTVGPNADLGFAQARERMKDILVAAYQATPGQPTFLEARDAVLAAAYATDMIDYRNFVAAFAKRGAGLDAVSPDRYSATNNGVVEGFSIGTDLAFAGAATVDDVSSCDRDGVLDSGETAHLNITLRNDSSQNLFATTATVSSTNANISFPSGNSISFPASAPRETVTGSVVVAMAAGLSGIQPYDIQITYGDPALLVPVNNATWSANGNMDDLTAQAQSEGFESNLPLAWTTITVGQLSGLTGWTRNALSLLDHNMKVSDQNGPTDLSLVSPTLLVGAGPFSLGFQHRYGFEFSGATFFDGGVVEITTDNGATWTDIGSLAVAPGNRYGGTLAAGTSPLGPRPAFVATSPGYPAYVATTINLGTTYAGKSVKVRFRAGSDANGVANGWEIDNVSFTGLANRPFPAQLPNKCAANVGNRKPSVTAVSGATTVPERSNATLTFTATDADGDALQFFFTQTTGTPVALTTTPIDNTHASASFTAPEVPVGNGSLQIAVQAFDGTAWSATATVNVTVTNLDRPPVANAGASQVVPERSLATLNGTGSSDPDGDALSFQWTQTAGPAVVLSSATAASPTFAAPEVPRAGSMLTFSLTVTALGVASAPATVNVGVVDVNRGPSVTAGLAQVVDERSLVQLHASASDPDGDPVTFSWTQLSPASPAIALAANAEPTFTAPEVTADTTFTFQVTASDGLASAQATVSVTVKNVNLAPVATARTASANVDERRTVTLDGTASFDPDSSTPLVSWRWTVDAATPLPPGATLTNANQALATFFTGEVEADTAVTFQLVVSDGILNSAPASLTLTVLDVNRAPVAAIASPAEAVARSVVTLSGLGSHDPDGSPLHYHWVQTSGPAVVLVGANKPLLAFVAPDVKETTLLGFQLQVDDGSLISQPANASIRVRKFTGNHDPGDDDGLSVSTAQVSGGCASAQTSSFAPILLVFAFGLLRRRRSG